MVPPELQAILLAGGEGERLYPLNEQPDITPKALLPIANRPLLYYPLKYLMDQGQVTFREIIIVVTKHIKHRIVQFLEDYADEFASLQHRTTGTAAGTAVAAATAAATTTAGVGGGAVAGAGSRINGAGDIAPRIIVETVDDSVVDSAQALKCCAKHIRRDFLVMSVDTICDIPLLDVLQVHRRNDATVTMVLKQQSRAMLPELASQLEATIPAGGDGGPHGSGTAIGVGGSDAKTRGGGGGKRGKKKGGKGGAVDDMMAGDSSMEVDRMKLTEYIGVDPKTHRVAFYSTGGGVVDGKLRLTRSFMRRWPNTVFSTSFLDAHFYIFSRWVMDLLNYDQIVAKRKEEELVRKEKENENVVSDDDDTLDNVQDSDENDSDNEDDSGNDSKRRTSEEDIDEAEHPLIVSHFTSIKHELVPYLVTRQHTKLDFDLRDREFPRSAMISAEYNMQTYAHRLSSTHVSNASPDLIKCFAFIAPFTVGEPRPMIHMSHLPASVYYCKRCETLTDYFDINRDIARGDVPMYALQHRITATPSTPIVAGAPGGTGSPLVAPSGGPLSSSASRARSLSSVGQKVIAPDGTETVEYQAHIGPLCVVGRGLQALGERVTLKKSNVGNHVKIGKNSKLSNSIIMDHVTIGEKYVHSIYLSIYLSTLSCSCFWSLWTL